MSIIFTAYLRCVFKCVPMTTSALLPEPRSVFVISYTSDMGITSSLTRFPPTLKALRLIVFTLFFDFGLKNTLRYILTYATNINNPPIIHPTIIPVTACVTLIVLNDDESKMKL